MKQTTPDIKDICVIGMGVSSLPIVRTLADQNMSFAVVSDKNFGVWGEAAKRGEDFDLVSSAALSAYSWWEYDEDFLFFSASEYYQKLLSDLTPNIRKKLIEERAVRYEEQVDGSYAVYTNKSGNEPRVLCKHLIVTVGQSVDSGKVLDLMDASLQLKNKTVFIRGYGDTTNMLMARLMIGDNRVIFSTSHFQNVEKVIAMPNRTPAAYGALDTIEEYQHFDTENHERSYRSAWASTVAPYSKFPLSRLFRKKTGLDDLVETEDFIREDQPHPVRAYLNRKGVSAGMGYPVKYWSVDGYFGQFDEGHKERMLKYRMLLNDPYFFIKTGQVRVVHPKRVEWISGDSCLIDGKAVVVDEVWDSQAGYPRKISIDRWDDSSWTYEYKDNLHGIWSAERPNVYFIGGERPTTGAFAATAEIQCAFIHHLIKETTFRTNMIENYDHNLRSWHHNYLKSGTSLNGIEHSQFSGVTNLALAKLMGVNMRFWPSLFKGRLAPYLAGTMLPSRWEKLTNAMPAYLAFSEKWTNQFLFSILTRSTWLAFAALNLVVLGVASVNIPMVLIGCVTLIPRTQKLIKCFVYDTLSYGQGRGVFKHLVYVFGFCLFINSISVLLGWSSQNVVVDALIFTGLLPAVFVAAIDIFRSFRSDRLLFNDVRGRELFASRLSQYKEDVRNTVWYKSITSDTSKTI